MRRYPLLALLTRRKEMEAQDRPSDEAILEQLQEIKSADQAPLIAPIRETVILCQEFDEHNHQRGQINTVSETLSHYRAVKRDGNCFLRAFGFQCMHQLITVGSPEEKAHFRDRLAKIYATLLTFPDMSPMILDDFYEPLRDMADAIVAGTLTADDLLQKFNDPMESDFLVMFLRLVIVAHLRTNHEFYAPFCGGSVEAFCTTDVQPMGRECDQVQIIALASAMEVGVEIISVDSASGPRDPLRNVFPEGMPPRIHLLFRPGHYDVLLP
ncbi:putative ubiquitin thioesterase OTUB1 [Paratrimastix pyriformis]|uniref:ubiquitinyl hydrolase 1 n=1 Tax=Paratrimastix pyriformis TaxID=342808 RepID=A0ABQ8UF92_9EUKA|nr:putative ubiquitin thioesterase OTUB1 [Paratrimastix pyriformis]